MYIKIEPRTARNSGSSIANSFQDQKDFLLSLASGSEFKVYKGDGTESVKEVWKRLRIESVTPVNKPGKSNYLAFTATDAESEDTSNILEGLICW